MKNLNKVRMTHSTVFKTFDTKDRFLKEAAVLQTLASTTLARSIPTVLGKTCDSSLCILKLSRIEGRMLTEHDLSDRFAERLGDLLANTHSLRTYDAVGGFDEQLRIFDPCPSFSQFAISQASKWRKRLAGFTEEYDEKAQVVWQTLQEHEKDLGTLGPPLFCHNDFDLKNILVKDGELTGLIDWEFAGAYPLSWELRKLIPILFWDRPELGTAFACGYHRRMPSVPFPSAGQQAVLVAADCIGALSWAFRICDTRRVEQLDALLAKAIQRLS